MTYDVRSFCIVATLKSSANVLWSSRNVIRHTGKIIMPVNLQVLISLVTSVIITFTFTSNLMVIWTFNNETPQQVNMTFHKLLSYRIRGLFGLMLNLVNQLYAIIEPFILWAWVSFHTVLQYANFKFLPIANIWGNHQIFDSPIITL